MLAEPAHAEDAADLLVGRGEEDDVAAQRLATALQQQHRQQLHHARALHVHRAAAVDAPVAHDAAERRHVPELLLDRHHVEVIAEQQRAAAAVAVQPRDQRLAARRNLDVLAGDALGLEQRAEEARGRGLVAGRVGGVDAQVALEDVQRLGVDGGPVDRFGHRVRRARH